MRAIRPANADNIVYDMMAAFYTACTSFIAQNLGARKRDRIRKAYLVTQMYSFIIGAVLGALLVVFRTQFLSLFTSDPDVALRLNKTGNNGMLLFCIRIYG